MVGAIIDHKELAERIEALDKKGLTRKALAQRLGVSDRTIRKWQTGETKISIAALQVLATIETEYKDNPEQKKKRGRPNKKS